ncbi:MAG: DUF1653 domain-containing protein [Clostridia bacterium]
MDRELKIGIYRHFKSMDKLYKVIGVAVHSETLEKMVMYISLYGENIGVTYVRPLDMFLEKVPEGRENPNNQIYRFEFLHE